jgi:hypothetical protein
MGRGEEGGWGGDEVGGRGLGGVMQYGDDPALIDRTRDGQGEGEGERALGDRTWKMDEA